MMSLKVQILTILTSFLFGIVISFIFGINYKFIYNDKKYIKIISSFILIMISVLSYFILLKNINNGIFHPYCLFSILLGYIVEHYIHIIFINKFTRIFKK